MYGIYLSIGWMLVIRVKALKLIAGLAFWTTTIVKKEVTKTVNCFLIFVDTSSNNGIFVIVITHDGIHVLVWTLSVLLFFSRLSGLQHIKVKGWSRAFLVLLISTTVLAVVSIVVLLFLSLRLIKSPLRPLVDGWLGPGLWFFYFRIFYSSTFMTWRSSSGRSLTTTDLLIYFVMYIRE